MKEFLETTGLIAILTTFIGALILSPVITFGFAYFGGFVLKVFVGNQVATGLNIVFATTRFTADLIPISCATFATIGKYFKSVQNNTSK